MTIKTNGKSKKGLSGKTNGHAHGQGPNEAQVQKILARAEKPLSAYDIIPLMAKKMGHPVAPVTVYRALQNLTEQSLVTRIESKNAYVLCRHPHEDHDCLFFICRSCGNATEAPDSTISHLLHKEASTLGFGINRQILEIVGFCKTCSRAQSKPVTRMS